MPNWCYNNMTIYGSLSDRDAFVNDMLVVDPVEPEITTYRIVKAVMPMPDALVGTRSPSPESPDPHPNWANLVASGEITQDHYDKLCQDTIDSYEAGQRTLQLTGYTDWYEWACANWGTKWGDCETNVEHRSDLTEISYQTAWGPFGQHFLRTMAKKYPTLLFVNTATEESSAFVVVGAYKNDDEFYKESEVPMFVDTADKEGWELIDEWQHEWIDNMIDSIPARFYEEITNGIESRN